MPGTKSTTAAVLFSLVSTTAVAQPYLEDRGPGVFTSMFRTYIRDHELLVYPFYEYTLQSLDDKPAEMGYGLDEDFRGKFREREAMLFVGYGVSDRLALEFESALFTKATLRKSPSDPSPTPSVIRESGLGDTQEQADWRWPRETASRPEVFSYLEVDLPLQRNRKVVLKLNNAFGLTPKALRLAPEIGRMFSFEEKKPVW